MSHGSPPPRSADEIRAWLIGKVSSHLRIPPQDVDCDEPLIAHGIDSMHFVVLVGELEDWLGCRFADNPLIDYPTISSLSAYLAEQLALGRSVIDPTQK